jgi:type I restriction enzyme S subunit
LKTGVAIQHFGPTHLGSVTIPAPPLAEMERIASDLAIERRDDDLLTRRLSDQIALLVEHRQALITAAVTGELEIPGRAA